MKFIICRVVGGELFPRDLPNSKLECLEWIVKYEQLPRFWVLNHIIDDSYRNKVLNILKDENITEMKFDYNIYKTKKTRNDKICYAVNINAARNHGIKICQKTSDFTISLDQDCLFLNEEYLKVISAIREDKFVKKYYGVLSRRIHVNNLSDYLSEGGEAMPIFRKDANSYFDVDIPFGNADKVELLNRLGYDNNFQVNGNMCKNVGYVSHLAFGEIESERDISYRCRKRQESLDLLLSRLNCIIKLL